MSEALKKLLGIEIKGTSAKDILDKAIKKETITTVKVTIGGKDLATLDDATKDAIVKELVMLDDTVSQSDVRAMLVGGGTITRKAKGKAKKVFIPTTPAQVECYKAVYGVVNRHRVSNAIKAGAEVIAAGGKLSADVIAAIKKHDKSTDQKAKVSLLADVKAAISAIGKPEAKPKFVPAKKK